MSKKYLFPCSCGFVRHIDISQAGQIIVCPKCKTEGKIPTLLKIKELEPAPEVSVKKRQTGHLRQAFLLIGIILLLPSAAFLIWTAPHFPQPKDVTNKREEFSFGGKTLYQNSTPLTRTEQNILWLEDRHFAMMMPIELFYHFHNLGESPNLSYNFQENYAALKDAYYIRLAAGIALVLLSLGLAVSSFFLPKAEAEVINWSGTEWT
ncbi:hypothetical protein FACS18942_01990 [Planctomycetales bacterium]|nr:hypothetical protein FACS18942_01990 [Planctomycetales bacterium]